MRERERERELWHGILFEEPNAERSEEPNSELIGLWKMTTLTTQETPPPRTLVYSRGNRAPVAKATHARNWEGPVPPRARERESWHGNFIQRTQPHREPPKRPNWAL